MLGTISPYVFPGMKDTIDYKKKKKFNRDKMSKEAVLSIVSNHCNISTDQILSRIRKGEVIDARHMFIAVLRLEFRYPLTDIANYIGRDHTTIMDSLKKYHDRYRCYMDYKVVSDSIFEEVKSKLNQ